MSVWLTFLWYTNGWSFIQPLPKSDGVLAHLSLGKYKSWATSAGIWKENLYSLCCVFIKLKKINCLKNIFSFCLIFAQFQERTPLPKLPKYAAKEKHVKQLKKGRERREKEKNSYYTGTKRINLGDNCLRRRLFWKTLSKVNMNCVAGVNYLISTRNCS